MNYPGAAAAEGIEFAANIFFGGTALAFGLGILVAFVVRHRYRVWLAAPIGGTAAAVLLGWQLGVGTEPAALVPLVGVGMLVAFWIALGTIAGREFIDYRRERSLKKTTSKM